MTQKDDITLEYPKPRDAWDTLSMKEKAEMIGVAVRNGITNLNDIRDRYNEFAEGGSKEEVVNTDEQYLTTMERVAEDNYQKWGFSNPDEALLHALNDNTYDYRGYYGKYPQSRANADTHWTDEFKTVYHPSFSNESIYSGQKSQYNPLGLPGGFWSGDTFVPMAWQLDTDEYKKGGSIHIAPSKKGTFTAAAKKHGKSVQTFASQVLAHPENYSPAMRKKANFARNASHWKHGLGGNLFEGTSQPTQKMQIGLDVQGWPNYTTEQIVAYGNENERRRKAIQDAYLNFVTESNDATAVANGRPQNQHLIDKAIQGAKANAAWEKEHPTLNTWGNIFSAVPFTVAAAPVGAWGLAGVSALGDAVAATSTGQAITAGLAPLTTAASTSVAGTPLYTWADVGLSSLFGGHGIQEAAEGNFTPMTALEIAPLGRLAKPVAKEVASSMRNYRYPLGKPQIPKDFPTLDSKVILADDKINDTSFFTWGNDSRFKVSPFKETYKDLYNQLSAAKRYKESPEYAKLVSEARKNSEALGFGDFPEDLFVAPNGKSVDIVFESRPKGQLGEYVPEKNAMFLDMTQAEGMEVPYHEGIHWQRVGNPSNIGPRFNKWWKARKSNQPDNIQRQLFDDFRNSEEYNRFVKRRNADNYIEHEVNESLYPFADDYLRAKGELQAHGLEAGRAVGIEPFTPYPGTVEALEAIEKARKYDPYLKDVKSGGEKNVERFWKILTGQLTPALIPVGLIGTKYNLNTK